MTRERDGRESAIGSQGKDADPIEQICQDISRRVRFSCSMVCLGSAFCSGLRPSCCRAPEEVRLHPIPVQTHVQYSCRGHNESAILVHDLECFMGEGFMENPSQNLVHNQHGENWIQNPQDTLSFHVISVSSLWGSNVPRESPGQLRRLDAVVGRHRVPALLSPEPSL